jgi:hypothetical protein
MDEVYDEMFWHVWHVEWPWRPNFSPFPSYHPI